MLTQQIASSHQSRTMCRMSRDFALNVAEYVVVTAGVALRVAGGMRRRLIAGHQAVVGRQR
jgi:hypothetical protein